MSAGGFAIVVGGRSVDVARPITALRAIAGLRAIPGDRTLRLRRTLRALLDLPRRARDDQRRGTHRGFARGGVLLRDDDVVVVHLVLEATLVGAVPRRGQQDAELLARLRKLALQLQQHVAARIPDRRALRGQDRRGGERDQLLRALACEVEV